MAGDDRHLDRDATRPLTEREVAELRDLLVADRRRRWAVSTIAGASRWIAIVIGAYFAIRGLWGEAISSILPSSGGE